MACHRVRTGSAASRTDLAGRIRAAGSRLGAAPGTGVGWSIRARAVRERGRLLTGQTPGFVDERRQDFRLKEGSPCIDAGADLPDAVLPQHRPGFQYVPHASRQPRPQAGRIDAGGLFTAGLRSGLYPDVVVATWAALSDSAGVQISYPDVVYLPVAVRGQ